MGARASSGEQALDNRGYTFVGGRKIDGSSWTYYKEPRTDRCVAVDTVNGKFASISYTRMMDCDNKLGD